MMSLSPISGAIRLMTKMLSPTGGWMRPISITTDMTTPNQTSSKPAARSGGRIIGAVIKMMLTGGRKNPRTMMRRTSAAKSSQRERWSATIHSAAPCEMCR